jgi:hypothetical protein
MTLVALATRQYKHGRRPSSEVRLARGIDAPSGGAASLEAFTPPQVGSASPEGSTRPSNEVPSLEG